MTDSKRKCGKPDRIRAARGEDYEVRYIANRFGVSQTTVRRIMARVGVMRSKVYAALRKLLAGRKRIRRAKA